MSDQQRHYGSYELLPAHPDLRCLVCTRPFTLDAEVTDSLEALAICRECKTTVLSDSNRDDTPRANRQRRWRRQQSSIRGVSVFSQLINLARQQGHEADTDSPTVPRRHTSYSSTPSRSQRGHTSDDESDGLSYADSVFGEIESNISFGDEGGESDTSLDRHTMVGREIGIQLDNESYMNTDTDIDPMNAGVYQWDSDDPEDDEDEESEESGLDEGDDTMQERRQQWHDIAPSGLNEQESEGAAWTWRTVGSQDINRTDLRVDMEGREIRRLFIGNPGDYVDARQFEMLLEQFADEDNSSRRGAPPAAASSIENLSSVVISKGYEINGGVTCPVCKDDMPITTVAKQLPCMHLYHSSCILPWLNSRNTCPVCRYELPTDDSEYERSKHAAVNEGGIHGVERTHPQEVVEETYEPEVDGGSNTGGDTMNETNTHEQHTAQQPNGAHGRHRWLFIAAAPVVSLVSLALVLCFTNPAGNVRRQLCRRSQTTTTARVDTRRSWWSMF
jgi:hypothetical protein